MHEPRWSSNHEHKHLGNAGQTGRKALITEVSYLKATTAREIKLRKRVKHPVIPGKFKIGKLSVSQLRRSIKNVLKPEVGGSDSLLKEAFKKKV